jgi:hypothetical protein
MTTDDLTLSYIVAKKVFSSPALVRRENTFPDRYKGKVPLMVKVIKPFGSDIPAFIPQRDPVGVSVGAEYPVWVNSHGAMAIIFANGETLGAKPDEVEVVLFHD